MDVGLTSEQLALRDTVRGILRAECPPDAARQACADPDRWRTLWKTFVDLGWTELAAYDAGGEFGPVELAVVLDGALQGGTCHADQVCGERRQRRRQRGVDRFHRRDGQGGRVNLDLGDGLSGAWWPRSRAPATG
ncbi:hypothetical protein A5656_26090 [Mycobacterium gordonae]|nr:acyl-CoA dehydrogenase family protein [Mycobacterium gordonae]OBK51373.1 hypothetical protein A5656_26090 [Mycobacterium gordonae]